MKMAAQKLRRIRLKKGSVRSVKAQGWSSTMGLPICRAMDWRKGSWAQCQRRKRRGGIPLRGPRLSPKGKL